MISIAIFHGKLLDQIFVFWGGGVAKPEIYCDDSSVDSLRLLGGAVPDLRCLIKIRNNIYTYIYI